MIYPQRKSGVIIGFTRHKNRLTDNTPIPEESGEFQEFLNRGPDKSINLGAMTEPEKVLLIDFMKANGILTTARANKLKG